MTRDTQGSAATQDERAVRLGDIVDRGVAAYNRADLDGFCACYAADVLVLDPFGGVTLEGIDAFRARYAQLFEQCRDVSAQIGGRLAHGEHLVDLVRWSRVHRKDEQCLTGEVLVRYTERDGRIAVIEFLGHRG